MKKIYTFFLFIFMGMTVIQTQAQIVVSELNYHSDSTQNASDWIELWNTSSSSVDVSGWQLVDGNLANLPYTIPNGTSIAADGRLVLVDNPTRFDALHPGVTRLGPIGFEFSNSGEVVTLKNNANQVMIQFTYDDSLPWNKCADGLGRTLELIDPAVSPTDPTNWRCGCIKGSPGEAFSPCSSETLVISEINYKSLLTEEAGDWVEIWNKTNGALNISGYKFRDDNDNNVYTFPGGTTLNPQERIVLYNDAVNFTLQHPSITKKVGPFSFGLDGNGDAVRLYNSSDRLIQSLWFDDDGEWYKCADGEGFTLELVTDFDQSMDISSYASWFCGCPKGSPGTAFINSCGVGVEENVATEWKLWPNPTSAILFVSSSTLVQEYAIYSVDRKAWGNGKPASTNLNLDVSQLPAGMYVLVLHTSTGSQRIKWIKQ